MVKSRSTESLDTIGKRLSKAHRAVRAFLEDRITRVHGIHLPTWVTLNVLVRTGSLRHRELAHVLGIEGPTLVRTIHAMERAGLVARQDDPDDRRATRIVPTKEGLALYRKVRPDMEAADAEIASALNRTELTALLRSLERVERRARELRETTTAKGPSRG